MMNWKKTAKWLLFPHPAFTLLLALAAGGLLVYSFLYLPETDLRRIASYVLSFYALTLCCLRVPDIVRFGLRVRRENRYAVRYFSDVQLRVKLSLSGALLFNAVYAVFQLGLGIWHRSTWFYAMAGYYVLLSLMRLMLVCFTGTHAPGERREAAWKTYRFCGACLLLMTLTLWIFILYFVFRIRAFRHHEITTIAMAAYTFASLTLAVIGAVRYRRYDSPVYSAAKAISLVSALVSVLTLENALLTAFGEEGGELFSQVMLGLTGTAVVCIVQGIAVCMIVHANKRLRAETQKNSEGS